MVGLAILSVRREVPSGAERFVADPATVGAPVPQRLAPAPAGGAST